MKKTKMIRIVNKLMDNNKMVFNKNKENTIF